MLTYNRSATNLVKAWREALQVQETAIQTISRLRQHHSRPEFTLPYFNKLWEDEKVARERAASEATRANLMARLPDAQLWNAAVNYLVAKRDWTRLSRSAMPVHDHGLDHMQTRPQQWANFGQMSSASQKLQSTQDQLFAHLARHRRDSVFQNDSHLADWIASPEGIQAGQFSRRRKYDKALDDLELACIDRFQEAERCSRPGTNYKLRQKIAGALRVRARGIDAAYKRYTQAWEQLPLGGKPELIKRESLGTDQDSVSDQFALARDGMASYSQEEWAQPVPREGIRQARKHDCAVMEQKQLAIELSRLLLWMQQAPQTIADEVNSSQLTEPVSRLWEEPAGCNLDTYPSAILPMLASLHAQERLQYLEQLVDSQKKTLSKIEIPATANLHRSSAFSFPPIKADRRLLPWRNSCKPLELAASLPRGRSASRMPDEGMDPRVEAQLPGLTDSADDALEAE